MISYLAFLRDKSLTRTLNPALIRAWYAFPEFKQAWLGFSESGNSGRGLGSKFAFSLHRNLHSVFRSFGKEKITQGSHIEKLALIEGGVGRDKISDFTANLIKDYLLRYTEDFAVRYLSSFQRRRFAVSKATFNYQTESWSSGTYNLPEFKGDFVALTPKDMLTIDDTWINRPDMIGGFESIVNSLPDDQLRAQLNNYLRSVLPMKPKAEEKREAVAQTIRRFPEFIEYYILTKEETGEDAISLSQAKVALTKKFFVDQIGSLAFMLSSESPFYELIGDTFDEALLRAEYLKDIVENKGGSRLFYVDGQPIKREKDLHILYRLTWFATPSDVSREVDDGRGPADFKISRGSEDKSIVEFKLASNTHLRRNLEKQVEIYKKASDADKGLKVIFYFSASEFKRVNEILDDLGIMGDPSIILIDARSENKPSASKA